MEITPRWDIRELAETGTRSEWAGKGAAALGLSGEVTPDAAARVFGSSRPPRIPPNVYLDLAERYRKVNGRYPDRFPDLPSIPDAREAVIRLWVDGLL